MPRRVTLTDRQKDALLRPDFAGGFAEALHPER